MKITVVEVTVFIVGVLTVANAGPDPSTPECNELKNLARKINRTDEYSPINRECLHNSHCTGLNCHAAFKPIDNPMVPQSWLKPFCYAFELMSCAAPLKVLVRVIDKNIDSTNYTYYFDQSGLRPVEKFKTKIQNAVEAQLYLNVTFSYDPHQRSTIFGIESAIKLESNIFGHYQSFPDWGKVELVPVSKFTVAPCTPETNFTISYNPCKLVPDLPKPVTTVKPPDYTGKSCSLKEISGCGENGYCVPDRAGTGRCQCALDALYNKVTETCEKHTKKPHIPSTGSTVIPTTIKSQAPSGGSNWLGLYIGIGVITAILLLAAVSAGVFYVRKRARYRGHTRVLMVDEDLDTALMSDEDDRPITL